MQHLGQGSLHSLSAIRKSLLEVGEPLWKLASTRKVPFCNLKEHLAESFPSEFRISPSEFRETVKIPNVENATGESENRTEMSPPDSPLDLKREGV